MKRQSTAVMVFTAIVALGIYDFAAVYFFPNAPSISQFFLSLHQRAPFVIIVMAIAVGHLFFPIVKEKE